MEEFPLQPYSSEKVDIYIYICMYVQLTVPIDGFSLLASVKYRPPAVFVSASAT